MVRPAAALTAMNALRSGENEATADDAFGSRTMLNELFVLVSRMNTCLVGGFGATGGVSAPMTLFPLGEIATTLPVTVAKVLTVTGLAVESTRIRPFSLPKSILSPHGVERMEFGTD